MTYRLCLPFLAAIALGVVLLGVKAKHFPDSRCAESEIPVATLPESRRPDFHKLLTEYALTLAEFPCPPESGDTGQSILVVQEPILWKDPTESQSGGFLRSSLLWILKGEQNEPFENAAVLGTFSISPPWVSPYVAATIAFDSQRSRYWMAMVSGGSWLNVEIYSFSPREIIARSRSSLLDSSTDWPLYPKPVAFARAPSQDSFGSESNCKLVTSLTMKVNAVVEGSNLVIQAHSTRDWKNQRTPVMLWTWQYAIDQNRLSLVEVADVPRPEPVLSERDESNRTRREQWASLVRDIEFRNYPKSKDPAGGGEVNNVLRFRRFQRSARHLGQRKHRLMKNSAR